MKKLLVGLLVLGNISAFASNDYYLPIFNCVDTAGDKVSLLITEAALCGLEEGPTNKGLLISTDSAGPGAIEVRVSYENGKTIARNKDLTFTIDSLNGDKGIVTFQDREDIFNLSCQAIHFHMDC